MQKHPPTIARNKTAIPLGYIFPKSTQEEKPKQKNTNDTPRITL